MLPDPLDPLEPWADMSPAERLEQLHLETWEKYQMLRRLVEEYARAHDSKQVERDLLDITATVDRTNP